MSTAARSRLAGAALLALALVAGHSAVFLLGRTLVPIAPGLSTLPGAPFGYQGPVADAPTTIDPAAGLNVSFANDAYTAGELARGSLPFWNAHQGLGAPYLASGHPAVLYPFTAVLPFLAHQHYEFVLLLNWYLGALFTYLFLRVIDVGEAGALIGGAAVAFSGFFQYYLPFREASAVAAWFPALLYGVERTLRQPRWRWRHVALAAPIYCTITAGQPESTALALTAVTLYGLASIALRPRRVAALSAFVPGVAAAALLTAPFWWTVSDYVFAAHSGHDPGSVAAQSTLGWRTLASYVMPQLYGRPQTLPPWMVPAGWSWDLSPGWIGVAVAIGALAGLGHAVRAASRPLLLIAAIAAVMAGRTWGIAPFTWIGYLPLFDRIVFPRYAAFILAFAAAMLAGAGWDALLARPARTWLRVAAAWIAIAVGLYLVAAIWREPVFRAVQVRAFSGVIALWIVTVPAGLLWLRTRLADAPSAIAPAVVAAMALQFAAFRPGYAPQTYVVLTLACLGAWGLLVALLALNTAARRHPALAIAAVLAVCALPEAVLAATDSRGLPRRYDAATAPPYAAMLAALQQATGGRAYALDGAPQTNFASVLRLDALNTCDPVQPRGAASFMQRYLDPGADPLWFSGNTGPRAAGAAMDAFRANRRFFNLAAVRYLLTRTTAVRPRGEDAGLRLAAIDAAAGVQIWEDQRAFPRAFLACPAAETPSTDAALDALATLPDLRRDIVVDRALGAVCGGNRRPSGVVLAFMPAANGFAVRFRSDDPGVLVVADAYERGWRARIDGRATDVLRVDGALLGVVLARQGDHVVEFSYAPPHWRPSLAAAAAGALILAAATFFRARRDNQTFTA